MKDVTHVFPLGDLREHVTSGLTCWCRPTVIEEPNGLIVVHNSMDRREEYEEGRRLH